MRPATALIGEVPNPTPFRQIGNGGYHDFYVGYDPATQQDKFYGAGLGGYSVWEANVIPHDLHRLFANDTFIWGGDLNTDPRMDDFSGFAGGNRRMFDIYREAGAHDTRTGFHRDYQQSFFRKGIRLGWQLDHLFADAATNAKTTSWNIDPAPAVGEGRCSDHAPMAVTMTSGPAM